MLFNQMNSDVEIRNFRVEIMRPSTPHNNNNNKHR